MGNNPAAYSAGLFPTKYKAVNNNYNYNIFDDNNDLINDTFLFKEIL